MSIRALHFAVALSGLLAITGAARAESPGDHARREEAHERLARQNERIREEHREQELRAQRAHDRREHEIHNEERRP
jgi:flagellar motility protein MotE (MotC chaperone)